MLPRRLRQTGRPRRPVPLVIIGVLLAATAALPALLPVAAEAQYFGRNKVLWERFEFEILETEHFLIHYYPRGAPHAEYVAALAERWYGRLSRFFDHELSEKKRIIVYQNHADFQQTTVTPGLIGEGTGGFTESLLDRVVLPLTGVNADNDHVIGHELVHVFQFDIAKTLAERNQNVQIQQLPLWMTEGLAEYLSQGRVDPATALWMRDAVRHDLLPKPDRLVQRRPSPYQYGQALWAYVAGRWSDDEVRRLYLGALTRGLERGIESTLGLSRDELLAEFHGALRDAYAPILAARENPAAEAEPLLTSETTGASVNLAPSLSPDGRRIAFLSTRQLELELYLADTETGKITKRLLHAEADRHFQNLSFLESSVAWSPDGARFALGVFDEGERRIAIYDVERGKVARVIDLPGIEAMRHPAWFPDGRSIVFSAIVAGASDLYRLDLETNALTRLTNDPYTAIEPGVSPDGRRIAFVTDRGRGTDLETLSFGDLGIAVLDVETGAIDVLPLFARGKHIDPQFSPDGASLYFIAEPDGVPNVFRYDFAAGRTVRITNLKTGVSGITGTSPALSVAADGTLAFSVLEDGGFEIFRIRAPEGVPIEAEPSFTAALLPPIEAEAEPSVVQRYLADATLGLPPPDRDYPTRDYRGRIRLADIAPATVGVVSTAGRGASLGGAFSAYFNDPLNRHQIVTTFRGGSSTSGALDFEDTLGADVTYLNQARRFEWGGSLSRIPYVTGTTLFSRQPVEIDGEVFPADVQEQLIVTEQVGSLSLLGRYPFSLNNRLEVSLGMSRIDFERELERFVFPIGAPAFHETIGLPSPDELDLRNASLAFVRDTSTFGLVSPARGTRLRVENQWTSGDLRFNTALVDYRRYFLHEPLTFALRVLHVGRHGPGAEDPRLPLLDIGSPFLMRGYELDSFDLSECTNDGEMTSCAELDRLVGSRIAVVNFEMRLALLGTEDFGLFDVPAAPTEALFFIDAGAAWSSGQSVDLAFERDTIERVPVVSAGLAVRTVLLGALPLELYYAFPFQRPEEDAVFGFRFGVGW
ncbi:MAG TPA: BamA/TamA family outer membrane protein [Gammaproteobacteria bacterium]